MIILDEWIRLVVLVQHQQSIQAWTRTPKISETVERQCGRYVVSYVWVEYICFGCPYRDVEADEVVLTHMSTELAWEQTENHSHQSQPHISVRYNIAPDSRCLQCELCYQPNAFACVHRTIVNYVVQDFRALAYVRNPYV